MKKDVTKLAERIVKYLKPYCQRIQIAGSIRRGEKNPRDIDIVLIPKNIDKLVTIGCYENLENNRIKILEFSEAIKSSSNTFNSSSAKLN